MKTALKTWPTLIAAFLVLALPPAAGAEQAPAASDPCKGFKWDVTRERALFAEPSVPLTAASHGRSAPLLRPGRLYRLQLAPAATVAFAAAPGKPAAADSYGGMVRLEVPAPGHYRIAVDAPLWIDMVTDGQRLAATDYEGQHECSAPRKIVEFDLEGAHRWILQLSSVAEANVRLAVVAVAVIP